jgi:hypothetical protein
MGKKEIRQRLEEFMMQGVFGRPAGDRASLNPLYTHDRAPLTPPLY